jgi:hypothetical protein
MEEVTMRIAARVIADCTDDPPYDNSTSRCSSMDGRFEVARSDNARISSDGRYIVFDSDSNSLSFVQSVDEAKPGPAPGAADWDYCCGAGPCGATVGYLNSLRSGGSGYNWPFEWSIFTNAYDDATYLEWYKDDLSTNRKIRDVYLRDGSAYTTTLVSEFCKYHEPGVQCDIEAVEDAINPSISDDGSIITFETKTPFLALDFNIGYQSGNLALPNAGDDIYAVERSQITGEIANLIRISNDTSRILAGNGNSTNALLSADGRFVVFESTASNLVSSDSNTVSDVFIFDRNFNKTLLCSKTQSGVQLNQASYMPTVSGSGEYLSFESASTNAGSSAGLSQAYIAKVIKNSDGSLKDCTVQLASSADGSGANASVIGSGVAVVPETKESGERSRRSAVVFESTASNLNSNSTDSNALRDIFQAPICSETDRTTDTDGDLTTDCFDQCYKDPIKVEDADSDSDGFANCEDGCANDPQKSGPGSCGCGVPDIDSDGDLTFDCKDTCPNDPGKTTPAICGCGIPDTDANGNGIADCKDSVIPTPAATATPIKSPTPTATATPDYGAIFKNLTPKQPSLKAGRRAGSLELNVNTDNVPSQIAVTGLDATFSCKEGSRTKTYAKEIHLVEL